MSGSWFGPIAADCMSPLLWSLTWVFVLFGAWCVPWWCLCGSSGVWWSWCWRGVEVSGCLILVWCCVGVLVSRWLRVLCWGMGLDGGCSCRGVEVFSGGGVPRVLTVS